VAEGDTAAFDAFYESARDRLAVQIAALTGDPTEAVDHVQEAFVRAWTRWSYVGGLDDPAGWVRRVAHNLAVSRWRRTRRVVLGRSPERAIDWDDEQRELIDALRLLPRPQREAIVLHYLVGLSVDEVGAELHAPSGTVKSWLSRGRASLARTLTAAEEVPT
jgi:RNA polymerase sigma-70 factor (ECF subfamily)